MPKEVVGEFNLELPDVLDDVVDAVVANDTVAIAHFIGSGKIEDTTHMAEIAYAALVALATVINTEHTISKRA